MKMFLVFQGGVEVFKFDIDRVNKKLKIASRKTNYEFVDMDWKYLFDKGKEEYQEKLTDGLNDDLFVKAIQLSMGKFGYELKT